MKADDKGSTTLNVLELAPATPCAETVEAIEKLLADAKAGRTIGLAYVALHAGADYSGDVIGRAKEHPIFVLGLCRVLEDKVASLRR